MELWGDRRGQPVQIGFILLFGVLVLAFAGYQGYVVPQENGQVEFNHNQQIQSQLQDVRSTVLRAGGLGTRQSASVQLGTTYPSRAIALNPAPATGTLRTVDGPSVTIENAKASGETGDYWNGSGAEFRTKSIRYRPEYNRYEDAPTTGNEHSVLYNEFPDGTVIAKSGQPLVSGRSLSFVFVDGRYGRSESGSVPLDAAPVSTSTNRVLVSNDTKSGITIGLQTTIPESVWVGELLDDQIDGADGSEIRCSEVGEPGNDSHPDRYIEDCDYEETGGDFNTLTLTLEKGETYTLQLAKVGVGTQVTGPSTTYVTDVEGDGATVPEGGEQRLVAEVRDHFDNPVSGGEACATATGDGSVAERFVTSGEDGHVSFTYEAPAVGDTRTETIVVGYECSNDGRPDTTNSTSYVEFEVTVNDLDGSGTGGGNGSSNPGR
jgi:hypothetical protein